MDPAREIYKGRGGGPVSVRNALSGSGTGGIIIWGGGLVFLVVMSRKLEGVHVSFLIQITGQK